MRTRVNLAERIQASGNPLAGGREERSVSTGYISDEQRRRLPEYARHRPLNLILARILLPLEL